MLFADLMQGVNPYEAFLSFPRSMQGIDELEDFSIVAQPSSSSSFPPSANAWTLEREEVCTAKSNSQIENISELGGIVEP